MNTNNKNNSLIAFISGAIGAVIGAVATKVASDPATQDKIKGMIGDMRDKMNPQDLRDTATELITDVVEDKVAARTGVKKETIKTMVDGVEKVTGRGPVSRTSSVKRAKRTTSSKQS